MATRNELKRGIESLASGNYERIETENTWCWMRNTIRSLKVAVLKGP